MRLAKHVYLSQRLYLAFIVKMGKRTKEQLTRANQQRNYLRSLSRKASFIAEYIQIKYSGIYNEASHYFDSLNAAHPTKADLRKTKEFRAWKAFMKGEQPKNRRKRVYNYVKNAPDQPENQWSQPPQEPESPRPQSSDQEPESPWPQSSDEEPESPWPQPSGEEPESPCLQLPQEPERMSSPATDNPGTPATPQTPQTPQEPPRYKDNMVLRIPLLQSPQTSPPTVTTETVEIVTEQTLEPITLDDIPHERIEHLIAELQQDPDIMGMFADIQAQLEFEELGLDIDIPELNLLEDELADW